MQITIDLPDSLHISEADLRIELAIALFQQDRISIGYASKIAKMHVMNFQKVISDRGICIHYDLEEFQEDVRYL